MRFLVCMALMFYSVSLFASENLEIKSQLIEMAKQNQQIQNDLNQYGVDKIPLVVLSMSTSIQILHTQTLKEIVKLYGWPNKQLVGKKGVLAAFNLVQHSSDLAFQQDMLPLIIQSYIDQDGIAGQDVATLTDKISIKQGNKQVFGTQVQRIDGKVVFAPIANVETVDQLRAQMGLSTLTEYKKSLEK